MNRRDQLGFYLIRIFFLGIFPALLVFGAVASLIGYDIINRQISDRTTLLANILTTSLNSFENISLRAFEAMGESIEEETDLTEAALTRLQSMLRIGLASGKYFEKIILLNRDARVVLSMPPDQDIIGNDYSLQEYFINVKNASKWSNAFTSIEAKQNNVAIYGLFGDYVLTSILNLEPLQELFDALLLSENEQLTLTDNKGMVIADSDRERVIAKERFQWMPALNENNQSQVQRISMGEGIVEVTSFKLEKSKWFMHLIRDESTLYLGLSTYLLVIGLVFLLLVLIVFALVFPLFRLMSAQLKDFVLAITSISEGRQKNLTLPSQIEEFYQLGVQVNRMVATLHSREGRILELNLSLESKVRERTRELEIKNKELSEALQTLKSTQDQLLLSEKMATVGQLVAGVAHEISTPVGVGLTAATFLESKISSITKAFVAEALSKNDFEKFIQTVRESSHIVARNLERASDLISSFKQVAVDHSVDDLRQFDVKSYCEEVVRNIRPALKHRPISVQVLIDEGIKIVSYPGGFSHILTNLIMNSLIHAYEAEQVGTIVIRANMDAENFTLSYTDDGKGISGLIMDKVFEPFFTTKRAEGNSGLGMHIIHNIVTNQLKGTIDLQSVENEGISVIIKIPSHECRLTSEQENK